MSAQPMASPYDVLFEPVQIGPLVTRNRFFQVPHCNGMGYRDPSAHAAMRRAKAEGGWGVVCTEEVEIHPTSDLTPYIELRAWDEKDLPALSLIASEIHAGGALAGIELVHGGLNAPNLTTRETPLAPHHLPVATYGYPPVQARAMTKQDIADVRRWHRQAVELSLRAGYDLVYVYAGHGMGTAQHFLSPRYNQRTDEYGGSAHNRIRLMRELLEDTLDVAAGRAAVACRVSVEEPHVPDGLRREHLEEVLSEIGELPDLWDFVLGDWAADSNTSRFGPEGEQEQLVRGLKQRTSKPVVGVGRFTSPDVMVHQVRSGVLDLIGAARPSIADPFLPHKIRAGRLAQIRECIGCNVCVSGDLTMSPIRCTQNPSMGEEFRRGWHPEHIRPLHAPERILVVGSGPAGLEAVRALGTRGYSVVLAEATRELGGRVLKEAALPGLSAWRRVVDYRLHAIAGLPNVEIYRESHFSADDLLEFGFEHVAVATGSSWRADGVARWHTRPISIDPGAEVLTPDDLMRGTRPSGRRVVLFDDDHYYLGGVLAGLLRQEGYEVDLVTPAALASAWTEQTLEVEKVQRELLLAGVRIRANEVLMSVAANSVLTENVFTGAPQELPCDTVVMVTARLPEDALHQHLMAAAAAGELRSVQAIGDACAPGTIAAAVWSGRRYAEEFGVEAGSADASLLRREVTELWSPPNPGPHSTVG
jgi:dimethylamine/trimethylamine dehydrogenase